MEGIVDRSFRLLLCGAGLWLACLAHPASDQAGGAASESTALFNARCALCHTVPDPALRPDRAWLDQVHRTA